MATPKYRRILVKLSGEALKGREGYGIDPHVVEFIAGQIGDVVRHGVQVAIVPGGGNIFRGLAASAEGMDRVTADYMGMLATILNGLALQDALEKQGIDTRVQTAIEMPAVAEPFIRRRAIRHMEKGRVVILAAGTGNPYFSTDTTAALRSMELGVEALLMGKNKVDGVYDDDPQVKPEAKKFEQLDYMEAVKLGLKVMDTAALALCMENNLPIIVFGIQEAGSIEKIVLGEKIGTLVTSLDQNQVVTE